MPASTDALSAFERTNFFYGLLLDADRLQKDHAFFNGKRSSGKWTLRAADSGAQFTNQGTLSHWGLRIVHAKPKLAADASGSQDISNLSVKAKANANGKLKLSGDAKQKSTQLKAGKRRTISFDPSNAVKDKVEEDGSAKATIELKFTDETGGTDAAKVKLLVTG